jgi:hypothetical protein
MGSITEFIQADLTVQNHTTPETFLVAELGDDNTMIGIEWIKKHNPKIDWSHGTLQFTRCPSNCQTKKTQPDTRPTLIESTEDLKETQTLNDSFYLPETIDITELETPTHRLAVGFTKSQAIAEQTTLKEGEKTFEEMVPLEFRQFKDTFSKKASERMPTRKPYDHAIELEGDATPVYSKVYPMSPREQQEFDEYLEENLKKGYIRPFKSNAAAPVFFIKKKDRTLCLVVDYRKLNTITVKDRYPIPVTQHLLNKLASAKIFSTLNLQWGYNNVHIKDGDETKAAFITNRGLYKPLVMGFGLCNALATFQRMMNDLFKDMINVCMVVYLDDIMIYSQDRKEHTSQV